MGWPTQPPGSCCPLGWSWTALHCRGCCVSAGGLAELSFAFIVIPTGPAAQLTAECGCPSLPGPTGGHRALLACLEGTWGLGPSSVTLWFWKVGLLPGVPGTELRSSVAGVPCGAWLAAVWAHWLELPQ